MICKHEVMQSNSHQSQLWKGKIVPKRTVWITTNVLQKEFIWIQPCAMRCACTPSDAIVSCVLWNTL